MSAAEIATGAGVGSPDRPLGVPLPAATRAEMRALARAALAEAAEADALGARLLAEAGRDGGAAFAAWLATPLPGEDDDNNNGGDDVPAGKA